MIKSFFGHNHPLITALLQSKNKEGLLSEISLCLQEGADAIGLQLETLPASMRGEAVLSELFGAAGDVPIYVTCYECDDLVAEDDDARAATLLRALYCGATMADIRCDMFCLSPYEMTDDPIAVGKQMALADEIHAMNKEVLFSCHVRNGRFFRFLTSEEVIALANEQKKRGADMAKIVTRADTDNELSGNFESIIRLRK
ncbi:MAG: type I 3-dehydroquinate dehydratase, partial [Firmicutes bacterium]|nr:type I 3-dehydroquinate dehydratase [Candidatus Colimorpha enterica]